MLSADEIAEVGFGVLVVLSVLTPAAILFAWLLRKAGMVGGPAAAAILGGVIAGGLLGASTLGKVAPDAYSAIFIGGVKEAAAMDKAQRGVMREIAALEASGVSAVAIEEYIARYEEKLAAYADRLSAVRRHRALALDAAPLALLCGVMALGAGWTGRMRTRPLTRGAVAAGFGMVLGAGVPVSLTVAWLGGFSNVQAWTLGGAIGIGSAWPTVRSRLFGAAGRSPETDASALVALCIGLATITIAVLSTVPIQSFAGAWSIVIIMVAITAAAWRVRSRHPRAPRRALALCNGVIIPALTAVCVAPIDLPDVAATRACIVASIAALLFASDGRWFGAWLGWRLLGDMDAKQSAWRKSAAVLANNVGAISIGAAALGRSAGLLDNAGMIAVIVGALFLETTTGLRHRFAVAFDDNVMEPPDSDDSDDDRDHLNRNHDSGQRP